MPAPERPLQTPETMTVMSSVPELATRHNSYFLHGIGVDAWPQQNSMIMAEAASFDTKLDICVAYEPHIATSVISSDNPKVRALFEMGLIVSDGTVTGVHVNDAASIASSISRRSTPYSKPSADFDLRPIIDNNLFRYNESTVDQPKFAGLYWRPSQREKNKSSNSLPRELLEAHSKFGLPIYVIGEDSLARPAHDIDRFGDYKTGEAVAPQDMKTYEPDIDRAALQIKLLDQGVFRVAGEERELVEASEKGRLAYFAEHKIFDGSGADIPDQYLRVVRRQVLRG